MNICRVKWDCQVVRDAFVILIAIVEGDVGLLYMHPHPQCRKAASLQPCQQDVLSNLWDFASWISEKCIWGKLSFVLL